MRSNRSSALWTKIDFGWRKMAHACLVVVIALITLVWYLVRQMKRLLIKLTLVSLLCLLLFWPQETAVTAATHYQYLPAISYPTFGTNVLNNASFEGSWYHPNGIAELQIPTDWTFSWKEGDNPLAPESWNQFVRPEVRVLPSAFLPVDEHDLFIWDGDQTLKVFKGFGSISFTLSANVPVKPGNYIFEVNVFPDLVVDYQNGEKVWAPDPLSGEVKLEAGSASTGWLLPQFGDKNIIRLPFTVTSNQTITVRASMRGRWAIRNNGWFMDDWGVYENNQ